MIDWSIALRRIAPRANARILSELAPHLDDAFDRFGIDTPMRQAHFLAQIVHESAGLTTFREIWGPTPAQKRYEGRRDLGNTQPGDGKRFMGRGPFQLTGRANYRHYGKRLGLDLEAHPELAESAENGLMIACIYWNDRKLSAKADRDDGRGVCKAINGGYNGIEDRLAILERAKRVLGCTTPLGLLSTPDEAAPADAELTKDEIQDIQCRLRELGYYEVGAADGKIGSSTRAAITAFRLQEDLTPGLEIDDEFLAALSKAEPRPIADARATADKREVASKVPEAKAALTTRLWSGIQAIGTGAIAVGAGIKSQFEDAMDQIYPLKSFFGSVPAWVWFALAFALAAFVWYRANRTTTKATEAYQSGARR